ncbi:MAG: hypothetical protein GXO76_15420 [Calditrichaeota bacterium]|nr:hypothetical protein [Calditrichota bacterium]
MFNKKPAVSTEERLKELEVEIKKALDAGKLKEAEGLIEEQRALLESLMASDDES